jgi:hypothetical protein
MARGISPDTYAKVMSRYDPEHQVGRPGRDASGGGAAIPFVLSTDNGSGDISFIPIL